MPKRAKDKQPSSTVDAVGERMAKISAAFFAKFPELYPVHRTPPKNRTPSV